MAELRKNEFGEPAAVFLLSSLDPQPVFRDFPFAHAAGLVLAAMPRLLHELNSVREVNKREI
jgi:hypothetical protein